MEQTEMIINIERRLPPRSEEELRRMQRRRRKDSAVLGVALTVLILLLAAAALLVILRPFVVVHGSAMSPAFSDGERLVMRRGALPKPGDAVVFRRDGAVLVRRCAALGGDVVTAGGDGTVFVNGVAMPGEYDDVPGVWSAGESVKVPEGSYFVVGDHRRVSFDSRISGFGCVAAEDVIGVIKR